MQNKLKLIWQYLIFKSLRSETVFSFFSLSCLFCVLFSRERPQQSVATRVSVSTQTASDDQPGKLWDELSLVGLPDAIDVQALFDPTGMSQSSIIATSWFCKAF